MAKCGSLAGVLLANGVVITVASLASVVLSAQDPASAPLATFRVETNLVHVDVVVTDSQGREVRGLTTDDFTLLEDGREQRITAFSFVDVPIGEMTADAGLAAESDVSNNARSFDGRVYLLVLDDLQTGVLQTDLVRNAAHRFVDRYLRDNDLMAVVDTSGRSDVGQAFTGNRRLLHEAIDAFVAGRIPGWRQILLLDGRPVQEPETRRRNRSQNAERMLKSVGELARWAGETMPGRRKSILLISEGVPGLAGCANRRSLSRVEDAACFAAVEAARANVGIYTVDPRGLDADRTFIEQARGTARSPTGLDRQTLTGQRSLRGLAEDTGGLAIVRTNDFDRGFEQVVRDSSSYYVLGYQPPDAGRGDFHSIQVRVGRAGLEVRARSGYQLAEVPLEPPPAQATGVSAALRDVLNSPIPVADLPMMAFAAPFRGTAGNTSVLIGAEFPDLSVAEPDDTGRRSARLQYAVAALSLREISQSRSGAVRAALGPAAVTALEEDGLRVLTRLELAPGLYQVRLAARDTNSGRNGLVLYDLEVPDFADRDASMSVSGLLLASARESGITTSDPPEPLLERLPVAPSAQRRFTLDDTLVVFAEAYEGSQSPAEVSVTARILTPDGASVFEKADSRSSVESTGGSGSYSHLFSLPLDTLTPGQYLVQVEVSSSRGDRTSRRVPFVAMAN